MSYSSTASVMSKVEAPCVFGRKVNALDSGTDRNTLKKIYEKLREINTFTFYLKYIR